MTWQDMWFAGRERVGGFINKKPVSVQSVFMTRG